MGPYLLLQKLGEGGMGAVVSGRDVNLGRKAAVKILPKTHSSTLIHFAFPPRGASRRQAHHVNIVGATT